MCLPCAIFIPSKKTSSSSTAFLHVRYFPVKTAADQILVFFNLNLVAEHCTVLAKRLTAATGEKRGVCLLAAIRLIWAWIIVRSPCVTCERSSPLPALPFAALQQFALLNDTLCPTVWLFAGLHVAFPTFRICRAFASGA